MTTENDTKFAKIQELKTIPHRKRIVAQKGIGKKGKVVITRKAKYGYEISDQRDLITRIKEPLTGQMLYHFGSDCYGVTSRQLERIKKKYVTVEVL